MTHVLECKLSGWNVEQKDWHELGRAESEFAAKSLFYTKHPRYEFAEWRQWVSEWTTSVTHEFRNSTRIEQYRVRPLEESELTDVV